MAALAARERPIIGVPAGVAILTAGYVYLVEPTLARTREQAALIPAREEVLSKRRALIAQRDAYAARLEEGSQAAEQGGAGGRPGAPPRAPPPPRPPPNPKSW